MKHYSIVIYCLLCSVSNTCLYAQEKEFIFKNFTQEEGLPSNEAYYIFEDSRHYIWAATDLGVVRYNGKKFEQFDLPDNVVFKIKEDSKGRIWFFSHTAQLAYFENEKIHAYKFNGAIRRRIKKIEIIEAYVDSEQNIILNSSIDSNYIISPAGDIQAYNHNIPKYISTEFKIDHFNEKGCAIQKTVSGALGSDTLIFSLNKNNRVYKYSISAKFTPFPHYGAITNNAGDIFFFGSNMLIKLKQDGSYILRKMPNDVLSLLLESGNLWVGMRKGGAVLLNTMSLKETGKLALPNKSISCVKSDYEGGLWFSSLENGVYYVKNTNIFHIKINEETNPDVSRLLNINDSMLIYASSSGLSKLINMKSEPLLKLKYYTTTDLFTDKKRTLYYMGTTDIANQIRKSTDSYFKYFYLLASTAEGVFKQDTLIYGNSNSLIKFRSSFRGGSTIKTLYDSNYYYNGKRILDKPSKPFLDFNSNIWAGNNDGLYKSNGTNDTLLKFKESSALLNKGVGCIRQLNNGIMVVGIRLGGIALIKDTNIIATITEKEGLLSNKIKYLLPLGNQLWVATAKGISVIRFTAYNPVKYTVTQIGKNDGFFNMTINQLVKYQENIAIATSNGLYFINHPNEFLERKLPAIPFYINSISSYGTDTSGVSDIILPYSKNRVLIKYSAVSFNSVDEISYLYRFDDSDTTWSNTNNNELLIENLKPGVYNFQIKATVPHQQRNSKIITLKITVQKPWWQNNWLRLMAAVLLPLLVYIFLKKRIEKIRDEEKRKTSLYGRIHDLEQEAFRSQMNPHFIFNCLTSIQQLILKGDKTEASEYLVKFARLIRKTMDLSAVPFITINAEIEYLSEYLTLEQLRMPDQFDYKLTLLNIDKPDKIEIPNMMIQPLIENSIRHGLKSLENRKGLVTVQFELNEGVVKCTVTDNGVGRNNLANSRRDFYSDHKSYGIDVIRKRLNAITELKQVKMNFEIKDLYLENGFAAGTQVIIQLPYKYKA